MADLRQFINEIHRRSIWQVVGIYVVGGWIAYEVVQSLTEGLGLPDWFPAFAVVLLIVGLPIVLATAFVQERGPGRPSEGLDGEAGPDDGTALAAARSGLLTWRNAIGGGIAAFALWGVIATVWLLRTGAPEASAGPGDAIAEIALRAQADLPAVAVLPFSDLSPERDFAWFADGVHEDILTSLSKLGGLLVLSRTSVMQYRDPQQSMREIGDELGASAIVEGSVSRFGDQVRITAQLIDTKTDTHLWADNFDRTLADVFAVRSEIALKVAEALQATLTPDEVRRVNAVPTTEMSAYDLYLEGRQAYEQYQQEDNERAIQLFKQAIAVDSSLALAWAGLGDAYGQTVSRWQYGIEWADSALVAGQRAVSLDPESAEAHKSVGLALSVLGDPEASIAAYRRALQLSPNNHAVTNNLGVSHYNAGRRGEAARWYAAALRLNPNGPFSRTNLSIALAELGFYERSEGLALEDIRLKGETSMNLWALVVPAYAQGRTHRDSVRVWTERRATLAPSAPAVRAWSSWVLLWAGDTASAQGHAAAALRQAPQGIFGLSKGPKTTLAEIALSRGDTATAREYLAQSETFLERTLERVPSPWTHYNLAMIHSMRDETEEAIRDLERAYELGINFPWFYEQEATLDSLREDPGYRALMDRVRATWEEQREQVLADGLVG